MIRIGLAIPVLCALMWVLALVLDPWPFGEAGVLVLGLGLLVAATVSTVGLIVTGGRWARLLGYGVVGVTALIAVQRPIDIIWVLAMFSSVLALGLLLSPTQMENVRRLPSASGPQPRVVAVPTTLLSVPMLFGLLSRDDLTGLAAVVALSAPVVALWFSRVIPGGLWAVRLLWPIGAVSAALFLGAKFGLLSAASGVLIAALAWHESVKTSYHPPFETGSTFPIPPEMTPAEVLDAAEIDDRGQRQ